MFLQGARGILHTPSHLAFFSRHQKYEKDLKMSSVCFLFFPGIPALHSDEFAIKGSRTFLNSFKKKNFKNCLKQYGRSGNTFRIYSSGVSEKENFLFTVLSLLFQLLLPELPPSPRLLLFCVSCICVFVFASPGSRRCERLKCRRSQHAAVR